MSFLREYRIKRGPVVGLLVVVALVGSYLIGRASLRPSLELLAPVTVPEAYEGTTYAFDGLVCLTAGDVGVEVTGVQDGGGPVETQLRQAPEGAPVTVAFPLEGEPGASLEGLRIPAGEQACVRVLTTPTRQGEERATEVEVSFRYGPGGLLRSSVSARPPVLLQTTGTGTDPRSEVE